MNCFMGYNPLVAKEVKITTWIKEFDGESPSYPSFPNDGDCFVVFATDEDALTHNALSKKTYTNGDWADAESGGGGDLTTAEVTISTTGNPSVSSGVFVVTENGIALLYERGLLGTSEIILYKGEASGEFYTIEEITTYSGNITIGEVELDEGTYITPFTITGDCSVTLVGENY